MGIPRRRFLQLTGAAALAPFAQIARADTFPSRVVKLVVGFPPGGGADLASRIVANRLSEIWSQQVIVENRPGAGARLALDAVAHAAADGYTMLLAPGSPQVQALLFSTLTFDPAVDFAPVSLVGTYPDIIVVPNSSPFQNLQEFIVYAKANPGKMSWASPGVGTVPHLAGELFKHMAGIEMTHVPYRGVTQGLMSDFIAGRLDLMFNTTGSLLQPVRSKQVRGLAVTTAQRFPSEPELPTVAEQGVAGYDVSSWYGIYLPAKTPPDIIKKMNADMIAMLSEPAIKQKFEPLGVLAQGSTPAELVAKNQADAALWGPIIKEANIKVE
ncbi:MAG TPA: tripartite tricarboxylate transporter substrate binding protein [Xanthobacteraceae bacterium]|jgi:tripartite-type tricarboxylate transporter receptor subunit TctC|nr:tripartite tricarboxylate transporter substrate binding protein [Xanthobacteraceae bacterium]